MRARTSLISPADAVPTQASRDTLASESEAHLSQLFICLPPLAIKKNQNAFRPSLSRHLGYVVLTIVRQYLREGPGRLQALTGQYQGALVFRPVGLVMNGPRHAGQDISVMPVRTSSPAAIVRLPEEHS